MNPDLRSSDDNGTVDMWERIDRICLEFEGSWKAGRPLPLRELVRDHRGAERAALLRELLLLDVDYRSRRGDRPCPEDYQPALPEDREAIADVFRSQGTDRLANTITERHDGSASLPAQREVGDYELLEVLGEGGMGVVYRARQRSADRVVALKVIRPDRLSCAAGERARQALERFHTEARLAARLEHDHIVPVYDVGDFDGQPYFSMRYVEGQGLDRLLSDGPLEAHAAATLLEPVARAVHYAHQHRIAHRDLKPRNILLGEQRRPYVADFGLAKLLQTRQELTQSGEPLGTPAYMPPEQARGETAGPAADIYSLGATLYEMLAGRPPFRAAGVAETLRQVIDRDPVPPRQLNPAVPRDLETICLKCLEKEPGRRYASAEQLAEELARFREGRPVLARPVGAPARCWRWCRLNPLVAALASVAAGLLLLLSVAGLLVAVAQARLRGIADAERDNARIAAGLAEHAADRAEKEENLAKQQTLAARQALYVAHTNLIQQYVKTNNVARVRSLLERHIPGADQEDVRSFEWYYWWRLCHGSHMTLEDADKQPVSDLHFSARGQLIASSFNKLKIWRLDDQRLQAELSGKFLISGLSSDRTSVIALATDGTIRRMDLACLQQTTIDSGKRQFLASARFSPDRRFLAVAYRDGVVELVDLSAGARKDLIGPTRLIPAEEVIDNDRSLDGSSKQVLKRFNQQHPAIQFRLPESRGLNFSPDGKLLAWVDGNEYVRIWDLGKDRQLAALNGPAAKSRQINGAIVRTHGLTASIVTFSPDSRFLYWNWGEGLRQWDPKKQEDKALIDTALDPSGLARFSTSRIFTDGKTVVVVGSSAGGNVRITLWDATTGRQTGRLDWSRGFDDKSTVVFSPDQRTLASVAGAVVELWDLGSGRKILTASAAPPVSDNRARKDRYGRSLVSKPTFSPDGKLLAWINADDTITLWDVADGRERASYRGHTGEMACLAFSTDNQILAVGGLQGAVRLWKTNEIDALLRGHGGQITGIAFSPDHGTIAVGNQNGTMDLLDLATSRSRATLKGPPGPVSALAYSPRGDALACAASGTLTLWDPKAGRQLAVLQDVMIEEKHIPAAAWDPRKPFDPAEAARMAIEQAKDGSALQARQRKNLITGLAFSADGSLLAWANGDGKVTVWDVGQRKQVRNELAGAGSGLAFLPDGKTLIGLDLRGRMVQWEATTIQRKNAPELKGGGRLLALAADGKTLALAGSKTAAIWDLERGQLKASLIGHAEEIVSLAFTPDGKTLATSSRDDVVKLWDLATFEEKASLEGLRAAAFSADGRFLGAVDAQGRLVLLQAATEAEVREAYPGQPAHQASVANP